MNLPALRHVGSSRTRDSTQVPCISRQILNYCAAREASFKKRKKYSFGCTVSWTQHVGSISPTRDWTRVPRVGSAASQPLAHQGSPRNLLFSGRQRGPWVREVASQLEMLLSRPSLLAATPAVVLTGAGRDLGSSMVHKVLTMGGGKFGCSVRV